MTTPTLSSAWTGIRNLIVNTGYINRSSVYRPPMADNAKMPAVSLSDLEAMSAGLQGDGDTQYWRQEMRAILYQEGKSSVYNPGLPKLLSAALHRQRFVVNGTTCFVRIAEVTFNGAESVDGTMQHTITLYVFGPLNSL